MARAFLLNEGHRKAYGCRNATSFSAAGHRRRMKPLSPTRIPHVLRHVQPLCAWPQTNSLFQLLQLFCWQPFCPSANSPSSRIVFCASPHILAATEHLTLTTFNLHTIGGDFGVVHPQGNEFLNLVVCDVSGHGVGSALMANRMYSEPPCARRENWSWQCVEAGSRFCAEPHRSGRLLFHHGRSAFFRARAPRHVCRSRPSTSSPRLQWHIVSGPL